MNFYTGVVENRDDPLKIGRCQVRIVGLHTEDKIKLPTEDLPWAHPIAPITSASMNGIGQTPVGPVLGTWVVIVFADPDEQFPLMMGTLPGIPQTKAADIAQEESDSDMLATNGGILLDSSGNEVTNSTGAPVQVGTQDSQSNPDPNAPSSTDATPPNLNEQKTPNKADDAVISSPIKVAPPPNSTSDVGKATESIQAIINACDQLGLTTKYAKAAILGICGGESSWLPIEEGSYYTKADSLAKIFPRSFPGGAAEAQAFTKWQGTKKDFFNKIYSSTGNGKLVGNIKPDDGGKYYGRGFNQLTGRAGYQQIQNFLKSKGISVNLMDNPDSLITDVNVAAQACVGFYALNVKADINSPDYFKAALTRTGADANGTGYGKKQKYYEYFLGQTVVADSTNKPTADSQNTYTKADVAGLPPAKQAALLEDRSANKTIGFSDPTGKYPLRNLMDEPDTNRLARGVQKETAIEFKDSSRTKNIPAPNGQDSWDQPLAPFGGIYPYAKVTETESGHLFVMDDTPLNETISLYHKNGTFIDIDANGTQVNKIVGDGYTIYDRNGSISIQGRCNITVGNSCNLYVMGTADVQIDGVATINCNNDVDIGVAQDMTLAVGGDLNIQVEGEFQVKSNSGIGMQSAVDFTMKSGANMYSQAAGDYSTKVAGNTFIDTAGNANILTAGDMFNQAVGTQHLRAGSNVNVDGSEFHGQEGASQGAVSGQEVLDIYTVQAPTAGDPNAEGVNADTQDTQGQQTEQQDQVQPADLSPPKPADFRSNQFDYLTTPVRPSPPVLTKYAIGQDNEAMVNDYIANPGKYNNPDAAAGGVKQNYAGTPKDDGQGGSLISNGAKNDIAIFLSKQLQAAQTGYWAETGMGGAPSNSNILRIWSDLGYPNSGIWMTDQTAWCMGFVNWTLKQCGYRYVQTASAAEITLNPQRWNATKIDIADAQPGDIAFWKYRHVNFVYTAQNGVLTFVGGNQANKAANNPSGGDVTQSWKSGYRGNGDGSLVAIYRPSSS